MPPRSTAFGVFDTGFGMAWFLGSWPMGVLYDVSLTGLIIFSMLFQLASLPVVPHERSVATTRGGSEAPDGVGRHRPRPRTDRPEAFEAACNALHDTGLSKEYATDRPANCHGS